MKRASIRQNGTGKYTVHSNRVRVCCEQTSSIPRHGRVGRGREICSHPLYWMLEARLTSKFQRPALKWIRSKERKKKKKKVQQKKLNKSVEQGLNLSGS